MYRILRCIRISLFTKEVFTIKAFYDGFQLEITALNDNDCPDIITTSLLELLPEDLVSDAWGNGDDFFD